MELSRTVADAVLDGAAEAILAADRSGTIQIWNPGAERIFGYSASEAIGQSLDLIIPERLHARHWSGYGQVMATGQSRYAAGDLLSVPGLHKDGQQISLEFTIVPLQDGNGCLTGVAAVVRDVTKPFEELKALRRKLALVTGSSTRDVNG